VLTTCSHSHANARCSRGTATFQNWGVRPAFLSIPFILLLGAHHLKPPSGSRKLRARPPNGFPRLMLLLMLMYSIYPRANLVTKSYDGCVMRVVFSRLQNCADFNDGDLGMAVVHSNTWDLKLRRHVNHYVTVLVCGKSRSP